MMHLRDNISKRQIARRTGLSRTTVSRYIDNYEKSIKELDMSSDKEASKVIINEIVTAPKPDYV